MDYYDEFEVGEFLVSFHTDGYLTKITKVFSAETLEELDDLYYLDKADIETNVADFVTQNYNESEIDLIWEAA